jgi:hypothetical protein
MTQLDDRFASLRSALAEAVSGDFSLVEARRRRQTVRSVLAAVVASVVALGGGGLVLAGAWDDDQATVTTYGDTTPSERIDLGSGISLDPPPPGANPQESAADAWAGYAHRAASQDIPASMIVRLGLLNGVGEDDQLVWSFEDSSAQGCVYTGPSPMPGESLPPRPSQCSWWTFLDANTGAPILTTQVPVE